MKKRLLSILLIVCMLLTVLPVTASASEVTITLTKEQLDDLSQVFNWGFYKAKYTEALKGTEGIGNWDEEKWKEHWRNYGLDAGWQGSPSFDPTYWIKNVNSGLKKNAAGYLAAANDYVQRLRDNEKTIDAQTSEHFNCSFYKLNYPIYMETDETIVKGIDWEWHEVFSRSYSSADRKTDQQALERLKLKLDPNGGTLFGKKESYIQYAADNSAYGYYGGADNEVQAVPYALPEPDIRQNVYFAGWWDTVVKDTVTADEAIYFQDKELTRTLKAVWKDNPEVTYNANGGVFDGGIGNVKLRPTYITAYGAMPRPTREGYTFLGWFTDAVLGNQVTESTAVDNKSSHTLYAHWQANEYNVSLAANGGYVNPKHVPVVVTYDSPYGHMPNVRKVGYELESWCRDEALEDPITAETLVKTAADHTLYAKWDPIEYTVNYVNGNETVYVDTYTYGKEFNLPTAEELELSVPANKHFVGWNTISSDANVVTYADGQKIVGGLSAVDGSEVTLYAVWEDNAVCRVIYNANGGSGAPTDDTRYYDEEEAKVALGDPVRPGYTFCGWSLDSAAEAAGYHAGDVFAMSGEDVTLYAVWAANTYTVTYDANGGAGTVDAQKFTYDVPSTLSDGSTLTREGHSFLGWALTADGGVAYAAGLPVLNLTTAANAVFDLYAAWEPNQLYVRFDANGGFCAIGGFDYIYGQAYGMLPEPQWEGRSFDGWFTERSGGKQVTETDLAGEITDLYAHWTAETYEVKLVQGEHYTLTAVTTSPVEYGNSYTFTVQVEKGYDEDKIIVLANGTILTGEDNRYTIENITEDQIVRVFGLEKETYPVTLYSDGSVLADLMSYTYGEGAVLPVPVRTGYTFQGWYDNEAFEGQPVTEIGPDERGEKIFYAKWKAVTYPVVFDANGGTGSVEDSGRYAIGDTILLPQAGVEKSGCELLGWNTDADAAYGEVGSYTIEESDVVNGIITFYAIWTKADNIQYAVEHYLQNTELSGYSLASGKTRVLAGVAGDYVTAVPETFCGFAYNSEKSVYDGVIAADGSLCLKLYYDRCSYSISFDANGGSVETAPVSYIYGIGAKLPAATRTGYVFDGWFASADLNGAAVTEIGTEEMGDKAFYAKWTPADGTIYIVEHYKQDLYGGYTKADTQILAGETDAYTDAQANTYEGFAALPVEQLKIAANGTTVVKAYYDRCSYLLVFDANGGIGGTSEQVLYEAPIQAPDVTRDGWSFTGWTPAVAERMPAEDVTYSANWTQDAYTITYDANGGTGFYSQSVYMSQLPTLSDGTGFARDGWTLVGWSTAPGENNAVDYGLGQSLDTAFVEAGQVLRLYAVWTQNTVTVTFDAGEGTVSPETMTYFENGNYENIPIAEREDYTFAGWFTEEGNQVVNGTALVSDEDHTLYAKWATDTYTIVYHANGGKEEDVTVSYALDETPTLEGAIFTRDTYDHVGWATAANGEIVYALGTKLDSDLVDRGETLHLYAVWGVADVKVSSYSGVYDGKDYMLTYELAEEITVTGWQWYFKPAGKSEFIPVDSENYNEFPVREVADSGIYYCHIDGLEDEYYVISFNTEQTTASITHRPVTFTAKDAQKVYDGTPLIEDGFTVTPYGDDVGLCEGHTARVTMTEESTITNVGRTPNVIESVAIFDEEGQDVTENYALSLLDGTLLITPREVKLISRGDIELPFGEDYDEMYDRLLEQYEVSPETPLGQGDTMEDLFISFEYSTDGETFYPLDEEALEELYDSNVDDFVVRPVVNSGNYILIDGESTELTVTLNKTRLWAKVRWYGTSRYTNRLSLTFYNAVYDEQTGQWSADESQSVTLPDVDTVRFTIRDYRTGEVLRSGDMTLNKGRYWANFTSVFVQVQVFFEADGYIIQSY